ncbi:hypothetical protein [Bradyrhizobium sp. STM 3561]|uniref:hypothetical protein n=1 Tax=Bradyrhizobium sp. STM 3561 TaxID=578923 RepID=UPI00388D9EF8
MKIIGLRPARPGAGAIAHVDIEPSPGVRIYGVRVSRSDDGSFRAFGPENERGRTCAFDRDVANQIAQLTVAGLSQNERLTS